MQPREGFFYNTPSVSLLLGAVLAVYVENPSGSNKDIIVEKYRVPNQASSFLDAMFYTNFTKTGSLTSLTPQPFRIGSPDNSIALVRTGTQAPSGTDSGIYLPLKGQDPNEVISAPIIIPPGRGLALVVSALVGAKVSAQFYVREVPIS